MKNQKKAQIALEFILLSILGFFILFTTIIALGSFSAQKTQEKIMIEAEDLGRSIQQELLIAADLQDGYQRTINIPEQIEDKKIQITTGTTTIDTGYFTFTLDQIELYYETPKITGTLKTGDNQITKTNNTITITN
ncbi:hypothetical protein K9L97_02795 [Candidatus Woesearchaeota archaeon]|nr:hypothetical protein [Candidatus Woesearchaeota archaeon]